MEIGKKSNNIGILTFHASHNNGSMLQAIALQHILETRYSLNTEIINFSNEAQRNMYSAMPKADKIKRVIRNAIWLTNIKEIRKQYSSFDTFMNNHMHLSRNAYKTAEELQVIEDEYVAIIMGSDQIWNIKCVDADDAYYGSFSKSLAKYAYAVSFGANNPFVIDRKYIDYVKEFKMISVRENNGKKWIKNSTGLDIDVCLDPTMLIDKDEWERIIDVGEPIIPGNYIFYYCFSITEDVQRFLSFVARKYKMPVYFSEAKEWALKTCWRHGIKRVKSYGPNVYLNLVKYARLFITTSFHGTAFATIYNKHFWYIDRGDNNPEKDDRAITFLNQLDLMDRYKTIKELKKMDLYIKHDYITSEKLLKDLRIKSFRYLDNMVRSINENFDKR